MESPEVIGVSGRHGRPRRSGAATHRSRNRPAGARECRSRTCCAGAGGRQSGGALVLGILALVCSVIPGFGLIVGNFAVTKGASTAADLRRTGQGGRGRAVAGEVMGVIAIGASIAIPIVFGFLL